MTVAGGTGSENVGMSNEQGDENSPRRMSKVSYPTSVVVGLAGPKAHPKGAADGEQVKIPALRTFVITKRGRMARAGAPHGWSRARRSPEGSQVRLPHGKSRGQAGNVPAMARGRCPGTRGVPRKAAKEKRTEPYRNRTHVDWCENTEANGITMLKELCKKASVTSG